MLAVLSSGGTTSLSRHLKKAFHTGLNVSPSDSICWWMGKSPSSCQYPRNAIPPTGWCHLSTITESLHNSQGKKKTYLQWEILGRLTKKHPKIIKDGNNSPPAAVAFMFWTSPASAGPSWPTRTTSRTAAPTSRLASERLTKFDVSLSRGLTTLHLSR